MKDIITRIYNKNKEEFFSLLLNNIKKNKKMNIITVNPEIIVISEKNSDINKILLNNDYTLVPDGIAVVKACNKFNNNINERITGIDIAKKLLDICNENKKSIYLYGAEEEVLKKLIDNIEKNYKNIKIIGYKNGYIKNEEIVFNEIKKLKPDVCLVALGVPKQEIFIDKYYESYKNGIFIGVGGSFDVLSGYKKRAPKFFIDHNIEWLYRILKEPKRLNRFFKYNIKFMLKTFFKK